MGAVTPPGATEPAVVAVDGGGSKTDAVVVSATGRVLGRASGPGSNHQSVGIDAAVAAVADAVGRAVAESGARPVLAHLCLAGADLPEEVALLRSRLAPLPVGGGERVEHVEHVVVDNDVLALLRSGTRAVDAAAVVCGTGMNAVARSADGAVARFPALGRLTGDWGGGHELAAEALWLAVRAEDGRGEPTALSALVPQALGRASAGEVAADVHLGRLPASRLHALVPVLLAAARAGDAAAAAVVARQAEEVVLMAATAMQRVGLLERPCDVVLGGGVLVGDARGDGGGSPLLDAVLAGLGRTAPLARPRVVDVPPVVGAALLALDDLHGGPVPLEVEARVRGEAPPDECGRIGAWRATGR